MVEHTEHKATQDEDEISLADVIRFFSLNGMFVLLTTLGLSAIAITLFLLQPKQYQKQLTLSVKPVPIPLSTGAFPAVDINQVSALAVTLLQNPSQGDISSTAKYEPATQQINLSLKSRNDNALTAADSKILSQLETGFQKTLEASFKDFLIRLELELKRNQEILAQLEKQIAQTPNNTSATVPNPRIQGLELQRSAYVTRMTTLEFDRDYLKRAEKNLAEFTSQAMSIQILTKSEVQQTQSLAQVAVLAVLASFMVAILAAIIRNQVARLQNEPSMQKIKGKNDV
ncbi:MAG TPA: hypothetical protein V6D30_07925 [Leptolyngbyaceae cyanobacterium]